MFENLILILKRKFKDERSALVTVKNWFSKQPPNKIADALLQANQSTVGAEVLLAVADSGYPSVMRLLLSKGLEPAKTLMPYGFNILHHVIANNLSSMTDVILENCSLSLLETRSREGATPLFLAVQQQNRQLVDKLLAKGASANVCDIHGLTPVGIALLKISPEILETLLKQPSTSALLFEDLACQTRLLGSLCQLPEHPLKLRCLNILFSHGAGFELSHIPDEIFRVYKLNRDQLKEIFVIGAQKQPDGSYKNRIISTIDMLKMVLTNPDWRLERSSLASACQHPLLLQNEITAQLRACLTDGIAVDAPLAPRLPEISQIERAPASILKRLKDEQHATVFQGENSIIEHCFRSMRSMQNQHLALTRLQVLLICALQSIDTMIGLAQFSTNYYHPTLVQFNQIIQGLMPSINANTPEHALPILVMLDEQVEDILKHHGKLLKVAHTALYNSLVDARALACIKMTRCYLTIGKHDVAITLALQGMALNDKIIIDNPMLELTTYFNKALALASAVKVYIAQGWVNKAHRLASEGLTLLASSGCYDDLTIEHISELANIIAQRNNLGRSLELIDKGISCLKQLYLLSESQTIHVVETSAKLAALRRSLIEDTFKSYSARLCSLLDTNCTIHIDDTTHSIYINPTVDIFSAHLQKPYFTFVENHPGFCLVDERRIKISQETLFSKHFFKHAALFAEVLATEPMKLGLDDALQALSDLHLTPTEKTYGFTKPVGFTPIVPITSARVPNNTLFMTMPENSETFAPFYKLIRHNNDYFPVTAIAPKGLNKHGVKLSTMQVTTDGATKPEKIAYGRLKIDGTLRAHGVVEQTVLGENGKQRKLYVFREVVTKKDEQRKGYKF